MKPLQGVRVLDLTQILSGPYATQMLADLGAEVIKIEQPGGDKSRQTGPFVQGRSTYFASVNRGKQSVVLNLKTMAGRQVFYDLVQRSAVVVENFRPGVADRLGVGFETLRQKNPTVIYAACSGFGQTGPRADQPALDIIIQALAGTMSVTGEVNGEPLRVGFSVGDLGAGLYLTVAILAALQQNARDPQAISVDLSMLDTQVALLENAYARYFATGEIPGPLGSRHPVIAPFQCFQAADGPFVVAASTDAQWNALVDAIERPDLAIDRRFRTASLRSREALALAQILNDVFAKRPVAQWVSQLEAAGVPVGRVNTVAQAADDERLITRKMFTSAKFGPTTVKVVGSPLRFNGQPCEAEPQVPNLNQHQSQVLTGLLNYDAKTIQRLQKEGAFEWPPEP